MFNDLTGVWKTDPKDIATREAYGNVVMDFRESGELIYTIIEEDKEQNFFYGLLS